MIKAADLPATTQATRSASHETILAADDFRRSLPAIRESLEQLRALAKMLEEQPEAVVYGARPPKGKPDDLSTLVRAPCCIAMSAGLALSGCKLQRPETIPARMIEPEPTGGSVPQGTGTHAAEVRLLETQARANIGRRLLHQLSGGELIEDPVWRWSSARDRYLDTALRLEFAANKDVRLVDSAEAPVLAVTLFGVAD